jgi:hypothetical protein
MSDASSMLKRFVVTSDAVAHMETRSFIWRSVLSQGYIHVWCAPANGGKSTVARFAASELAEDGLDVFYLNEDAGYGELKELQEHAAQSGYHLLNSSLTDSNTDEILAAMENLRSSNCDLSNCVFFIDTLKKFLDILDKRKSSSFMKLLRTLSVNGATIVLLHHTTKRPDLNGNRLFDGVGDLRNDADELHYLAMDELQGQTVRTITITPDKRRSPAALTTFKYFPDSRHIEATDTPVDVLNEIQLRKQRERDAAVIDEINRRLLAGPCAITDLAKQVSEILGVNEKRVREVVARWSSTGPGSSQSAWCEERVQPNNKRMISLPSQSSKLE